jgi:hypothetical protein
MSRITVEDAFRMLAEWGAERATIHVAMSRPAMRIGGKPAESDAILREVLPHSQKALLALRDENGEDVGVTVSLEGAEWEKGADTAWVRFVAAKFADGSRFVFGERASRAL